MNTVSDPRRPSIPLVSSSMSRQASGGSSQASTVSPRLHRTVSGMQTKRKARNLLRDYYGLGGNEALAAGKDPLNTDSPTFEPAKLFDQLYTTSSLPALLKKERDLLTEIRELESEKQTLVYNHHHELIDASDKIQTMKSRAETLDFQLDSLRDSFESIAQLTAQLTTSLSRLHQPAPHSSADPTFDPLVHLPPLIELPQRLRAIESFEEKSALWVQYEEILSAWDEAGIEGIKAIQQDCREALRRSRRPSELPLS